MSPVHLQSSYMIYKLLIRHWDCVSKNSLVSRVVKVSSSYEVHETVSNSTMD